MKKHALKPSFTTYLVLILWLSTGTITRAQSLPQAVISNDTALIINLLQANADPDAMDANGRTPLTIASEAGQTGIVNLLLAYGADPDLSDTNGLTPLIYSAKNGYIDQVNILLAHSADVMYQDPARMNAFDHAVEGSPPPVLNPGVVVDFDAVYTVLYTIIAQ